jgi:hypothetical protein
VALTREAAVRRIDELIELRWAQLAEGRCPRCEATAEPHADPGPDEVVQVDVVHSEGCPLASWDEFNELAEAWRVPVGMGVWSRPHPAAGAPVLRYLGPCRLPDTVPGGEALRLRARG